MIITATLLATAAAIHYTTTFVLSLAAGAAAVGGVAAGVAVYYLKSPAQSEADIKELASLRAELASRKETLITAAETRVAHAADSVATITATTEQLHAHIDVSAKVFEKETELTKDANLQLMDVVTLLQKVGEETGSKANPLLEEIGCRLSQLDTIKSELNKTRASLEDTERRLHETVAQHGRAQETLSGTINANALEISRLTTQLQEAQRLVEPNNEAIQITKRALEVAEGEKTKLASKASELEKSLGSMTLELSTMTAARANQNVNMKKLLQTNDELTQKVRELSGNLNEDVRAPGGPRTLTLFR
jgi:chromosome segregation ATPase